jgi:hypothetical protein
MFVKKLSVAIKTIHRSATRANASATLPTDLSILRDEKSGLLITTPTEVVTKLAQMETGTLSPYPTLLPRAPFPLLGHVGQTPTSSFPMISGRITLTIMQETLHRTPDHKAASPDGVPGLVLKHMPPAFHEALHLIFQAMSITGITPPCWLKSNTILFNTKGTQSGWTATAQSPWLMPFTRFGLSV